VPAFSSGVDREQAGLADVHGIAPHEAHPATVRRAARGAGDRKAVQEWVADLRRQTFERKKPDGSVIKTYKLSRKSILNIVGVLKLALGRKAWMSWEELNLGKPPRSKQRYFTEEQLKRIIEAAPGQYRMLFAVLAGTGMRIGEAAGLYVEDVDIDSQVVCPQEHLERRGPGPEDGECDPGGRHR
jgi:integrase